jgi:hypothetical protein
LSNSWDAIANAGVHVMDSYSLGILIQDYWFNTGRGVNRVPAPLQKAVQRMQTPNLKMRPRLQPLLKCPVFDTPYQKLQLQLEEITIQPVEQKVMLWQNLGQQLQTPNALPKDVALYKVLPLIIHSIQTITSNESMLAQDMYRREGKVYTRRRGTMDGGDSTNHNTMMMKKKQKKTLIELPAFLTFSFAIAFSPLQFWQCWFPSFSLKSIIRTRPRSGRKWRP